MKGVDAPIIPVNLDGVWGSIFSFERGRFIWKRPRRLAHPVTVSYGEPLPARAEPWQLRSAIQALATEAWIDRKQDRRPLHVTALVEGRRSLTGAFFEPGQEPLSRAELLARALALRDALIDRWGPRRRVGA